MWWRQPWHLVFGNLAQLVAALARVAMLLAAPGWPAYLLAYLLFGNIDLKV